jgi:hypothetical protein
MRRFKELITTWKHVRVFVRERFPKTSVLRARNTFVPGGRFTVLLQLFVPSAARNGLELSEYSTADTPKVSLAAPVSCAATVVSRAPAAGVVMLTVGRLFTTKLIFVVEVPPRLSVATAENA